MKIIGTKNEIELLLSSLPGAPKDNSPIPPVGWVTSYKGVPIEIEITSGYWQWRGTQKKQTQK